MRTYARSSRTSVLLGLLLVGLLSATLLLSVSCSLMNIREEGTATQFLEYVMEDGYEDAYAMLGDTVPESEFEPVWTSLQELCRGATEFDLEQQNAKLTTTDGTTRIEQSYLVTLDNGKTFSFRVVLAKETAHELLGLHFRDVTEFIAETDGYVPTVNTVLTVVSFLFLGFRVWMLIDCLLRKLARRKALWVLLILLSGTLTLTLGDVTGIKLGIALLYDDMTMLADPMAYTVTLALSLPVGALIYRIVRKRLALVEPPAASDDGTTEPPTEDTSPTESSAPTDGPDTP